MKLTSNTKDNQRMPEDLFFPVYEKKLPLDFASANWKQKGYVNVPGKELALLMASLPDVIDWLHKREFPQMFTCSPCQTPLMLLDKDVSFSRLLFHYDNTPDSASVIQAFLEMFELQIKESQAIIISPSFISKSKLTEEQSVIGLIKNHTKETSFIKFNFTKIGDFWSYAIQNSCSLLVTTKSYQADLANVLFYFYKGERLQNRLSIFLS